MESTPQITPPGDQPESLPAHLLAADGITPLTRPQIMDRCKLAYCSGVANLPTLSVRYRVPLDTLKKHSAAEKWVKTKEEAREIVSSSLAPNIANWLQNERQEQVKRSLRRASRLQQEVDKFLDCPPNDLEASDLRDIATTEEKVDAVIRRNLGMESESSGSGRFNLNVMGDVQIVSA